MLSSTSRGDFHELGEFFLAGTDASSRINKRRSPIPGWNAQAFSGSWTVAEHQNGGHGLPDILYGRHATV